jgi:hypothetical protein
MAKCHNAPMARVAASCSPVVSSNKLSVVRVFDNRGPSLACGNTDDQCAGTPPFGSHVLCAKCGPIPKPPISAFVTQCQHALT